MSKYRGVVLLVKGYLAAKSMGSDAVWKDSTEQRMLFEKTLPLLFELPVKKAIPAFAGTSFEHNSGKPLLHTYFPQCKMVL